MKTVALVTGAASLPGREVVDRLAREGFFVYAGTRHPKNFALKDPKIEAVQLDVTKKEEIIKVVQKIANKFGRLDVLINLAGVTVHGSFLKLEEESFKDMLDVNLFGVYRAIKYFFPLLKKSKSGRIINITSLTGIASFPNMAAYSASKHALEALGQGVRSELLKEGVWLTNIAPGAVSSDKEVKLDYKPMRERYKLINFLMPMVTRQEIAGSILEVINSQNPPMRILLGNDVKIVNLIKRILPNFLWDKLVLALWR